MELIEPIKLGFFTRMSVYPSGAIRISESAAPLGSSLETIFLMPHEVKKLRMILNEMEN